MKQPLTLKQKQVFDFITYTIQTTGVAPTWEEINRTFHWNSTNSAQQYVRALEEKGWLNRGPANHKRSLTLNREAMNLSDAVELPLCGYVAAGSPIEAIEQHETTSVPLHMVNTRYENIVLKVRGDSMQDDGILDGDSLIIRKQKEVKNGQTVIALIDNEATVKKIYFKKDHIELHPANPKYQPIIVKHTKEFHIEGIVVGLIRKL